MRVLLAGGGTAGHINPALAIAGIIKENEPQSQILFVGNLGGMEERLVKNAGYDFRSIKISGFDRKLSLKAVKKNIITLKRIVTASIKAGKILKEFCPDICIGTGGYVSGPVIREAVRLKIPTVIHEQNAYPGITNKMLSGKVNAVMLGIDEAKNHISKKAKTFLTGNPVRSDIICADKETCKKRLNLDRKPVILSFGGSLGARNVNEAVISLIEYSSRNGDFHHIHAYGKHGRWFIPTLLEKGIDVTENKDLDIREYIDDMPVCLAAADLVISRAGAITISEIQASSKASILIPSPNVAENHQYHNAMALVNANAACVIEEKDLTGKRLIDTVYSLFNNKNTITTYELNAGKMAVVDSPQRIYKVIQDVLRGTM